ncbi:MAG: adenylate/guanylate cyclase domain-containing protein [Halieaceae bacterium]|jgi:class 3 adenylate cyclase/tetratricopeptide (TPR) repeat protein|nr:adenylate/guanylate cyclase domain-containing protein [Halieaceae bacterium]
MKCPSCSAVNPQGQAVCQQCASPLPQECDLCGFVCEPSARFCGGCGARLTLAAGAAHHSAVPTPIAQLAGAAQRRHLTVMFCDLVGSTDLSVRVDPEDLSDILRQYQLTCEQIVTRYNGYIARYTGDGLLVYFGYPRATEHGAESAVRAGLDMVDNVRKLRLGPLYALHTRIGIASGPVVVGDVVGDGPSRETTVVGATPNLAARLQDICAPDTVVISGHTYELVRGRFDYSDLGYHQLKGFDKPVHVYAVVGESLVESRFAAAHDRLPGALLGRGRERQALQETWEKARSGEGQVVMIRGEEGIGKSHLLESFLDSLAPTAAEVVRLYGAPHARGNVLHPIVLNWQRQCGIESSDSTPVKIGKLKRRLDQLGSSDPDELALIATLLSIPRGEHFKGLKLTPATLRTRTLNLLVSQITRRCLERPIVLVFEDLQWLDTGSQDFLTLLIKESPQLPLMIVGSHRPQFKTPWPDEAETRVIELGFLDPGASRDLIARVSGGESLPEKVVADILEKTDGIPLFIEELTRATLENPTLADWETPGDDDSFPPIPGTLQDSLNARLDRLGSAKDIAQVGAAIGREFRLDLLLAVVDRPAEQVEAALQKLVAAQLVSSRGKAPHKTFFFRHALIQEIAYGSLLRSTRRRLHAHIARTLAQRFRAQVQGRPDLLAHHYSEAQLHEQAFRYWYIASQKALSQFAPGEVVLQLNRALALTEKLPEDVELIAMEFEMRSMLGACLMVLNGPGHRDVGAAFQQAYDFCMEREALQDSFPVKFGLCRYHWATGRIPQAVTEAESLLPLVDVHRDRGQYMAVNVLLGVSLWHRGENHRALQCLRRVTSCYRANRDAQLFFTYMMDFGVVGRLYQALTLLSLGRREESVRAARACLALARELDNPYSIGFGFMANFMIALFCGEFQTCIGFADECINFASNQGFPEFVGMAKACKGSALVKTGQRGGGLEMIQEGVEEWEKTGFGAGRPLLRGMLADACLVSGQYQRAREQLTLALTLMEEQEERQSAPFLAGIERRLGTATR